MFEFLKNIFRKLPQPWISEEEDLMLDIEKLDREQPGWDNPSRIATVKYMLAKGTDRELLVSCYGNEIVEAAEMDEHEN